MNIQIAEKDLMKLCYQPKNRTEFNCKLNLEDITDENYSHAQRVWNEFEIKNLDEYDNLCVQSDTLLLADVFEKFRETCIEIY